MDNELSRPLTRAEILNFDKLRLRWKELSVEDIILDGLYLNCIRLVKEYFEKNLKIDLKPKKINAIGLKSVLQLLADKDLNGAEKLLNQMKFDFNQKIYQICFFTPYKQLRDYLLSVLIEKNNLNEKEIEIVNFLKKLELAYQCRSFEIVKKSIQPFKNFNLNWNLNSDLVKNENFMSQELVKYIYTDKADTNTNTNRYSHAVIEWLREWSPKMQDEILADSLMLDQSSEINMVDHKTVWAVLVEQNNVYAINDWINSSCAVKAEGDEAQGRFRDKLDKEMIDLIFNSRCLPNESKEMLLNRLSKYGSYKFNKTNTIVSEELNFNFSRLNVFCSQEKNDFTKLISRLSSSSTFFDQKLFKSRDDSFHMEFISHFLNNKKHLPVNLLWSYLSYYNLVNVDKSSHALLTDSQQIDINSSNCLKMMLAFRQNLNMSYLDSASYFSNVCIKNVEFYLNQADNLQISSLFSPKYKEHHLLALAISLYFDIPLSSTESSKLEHLLEEYPSIRLIIDSKHTNQPSSLYSLLQEHTKFDVTKCFNWQKSNNMSLFKHDEKTKLSQIISFENFEFAKRHSFKDSLDYAFFLKQGRPFFAYNYFMQMQIKKHGKINKTLMDEARLRTSLILIESFQDSRVVSSCVTFSELMNADTFKLKLNVYLLNILNEHYKKHGLDEKMAAEKSKNVFVEFFKEEVEPKRIVSLFEHVLITAMIENYDLKNMFTMDACSIWLPLMCFCKIHNLPYSSKYLQLCAESNQWLMYLLFSQLYQIPRFQVISGLENFTDIGLKQHLEYALHNVITSTQPNEAASKSSLMASNLKNVIEKTGTKLSSMISAFKGKKSRKTARKLDESKKVSKTSNSTENEDSDELDNEQPKPNETEYKETLESIDFYELLISCQNSPEPVLKLQIEALRWHTPVLAVFATFYQVVTLKNTKDGLRAFSQHDKISCLCTFLYASMKQHLSQTKHNNEKSSNQKSVLFGLNELKEAIQIAASKSYLRTLLNSLRIFIPRTILNIYVEFLYNIFVIKDSNQALKLHSNYKHELIKVTLSKHQSFIPLEWYEEVINKLTRITTLKCHTIDDLQNLTSILGPSNEYRRLIKLVHTLKSNKISVNCDEWLDMDDKSDQFNEICFKVIEELLKMQKFNDAEDLADFCELSKDRIHLARIGRQIEILRLNNDFEEILEFWKNAHIQLMKIGIKDSDFIDFLKFQNSRSNLMLERIVLLNLICQLCPNDGETSKNLWVLLFHFVVEHKKKTEVNNLREIFKKMLLFGIVMEDPVRELLNFIIKEGRVNDFNDTNNTLNDQDKDALNILLYNLVDIGKLTQAYVIAKHFKYFNQDFIILLNMIYICLGMLKPEDLDYTNHALDTTNFKGVKLTNVLRSMSRTSDSNESIKDRVDFLEKLVGFCKYGNKFSKRLKLDFQLANEILKISYTKLLNEDEWTLFKMVLYSSYSNRFKVAKEFVKTYELNPKLLCDFILKELLITLNSMTMINKNNSVPPNSQLMLDPSDNNEFSNLIKMFGQNTNLFGWKLLEKSRVFLNEAKTNQDFTILTELLIRSHDCFTQSCSMEGISNVLQTCKLCATKLEKAGEFNIMIRLLTGIAHFSEMTYVMDFLWNNHQFEMLFGKGIGKEDKLRLALLDYLKRYHPNDHETYTMVTLNFTMHREIAIMLEEAAYQQLKLLKDKKLENTSEILTYLQSILQYFSDAAQSYMKEDCIKQAESCIKKARLIALQIHFLSSNLFIVNLTSSDASKFIINHTKFWEAYIVSEAYKKKSEWPLALFNQFILNNNEKYLVDFKAHLQITPTLLEEVTNRYKLCLESNSDKLTSQSVENMKRLLKNCKEIGQYYRLAAYLDFKDLLDEIQTKKYSSIINDLILNKKI